MQRKIDVKLLIGSAISSDPQARVINPNLNQMVQKTQECRLHSMAIEFIIKGQRIPVLVSWEVGSLEVSKDLQVKIEKSHFTVDMSFRFYTRKP